MKVNIHAGHNQDGKVACGVVSLIKESTESRKVKDELIKLIQKNGDIAYDCTVNDGKSQNDVLKKICTKCNNTDAELNISIHFNSAAKDLVGNGKTTGTECYVYNINSDTAKIAKRICEEIAKIGYKNRGVKESKNLYVLKHTKKAAILVECCFADDKDDVELYDYKKMAEAIYKGIFQKEIQNDTKIETGKMYTVQIGAFSKIENAERLKSELVKKGYNPIIKEV